MKNKLFIATLCIFLIITLPICFADTYKLIYDANGNLITGDGKYREYNEFNQLIRVRAGYDASGRILEEYVWYPTEDRIWAKHVYKLDGQVAFEIQYSDENFVRELNVSAGGWDRDYIYVKDETGIVAEKRENYQPTFYHNDHLGSTTLVTNSTGHVVENTFYEPFGGIIAGGSRRYDYEGKEFSSSTNDYDFHFRKYDAGLKIFTQPDSLLPNVYDPQQLNRYSFERNNPYGNKDETGHYIPETKGKLAWGAPYGAWLAKQFRQIAARQELHQKLLSEYMTAHPEIHQTCFGCEGQKLPSIYELEEIELRRKLDVILTEKYEVKAYVYENKLIYQMSTFQEMGFSKSAVSKIAKEKQEFYQSKGYRNEEVFNTAAWADLYNKANNPKKGQTAGDIVREWRKKWS